MVPVLQYLPRATLASIVFVSAIGLIDTKEIAFVFQLRAWSEILMFSATFVITCVTSIQTGILICLCLSALLIVRRTTQASMSVLGRVHHGNTTTGITSDPNSPAMKQSSSSTNPGFLHTHVFNKNIDNQPNNNSDAITLAESPTNPTASHKLPIPETHTASTAGFSFVPVDENPSAELLEGVIFLRIEAPLLFYNAGQARRAIESLLQAEMQVATDRRLRTRRGRGMSTISGDTMVYDALDFDGDPDHEHELGSPVERDSNVGNGFEGRNYNRGHAVVVDEIEVGMELENMGDLVGADVADMDVPGKVRSRNGSNGPRGGGVGGGDGEDKKGKGKMKGWKKRGDNGGMVVDVDVDDGDDHVVVGLGLHTIVFDFKRCSDLDSAATFVIRKIFQTFIAKGVRIIFVGLYDFHVNLFQRAGMSDMMEGNVFDTMFGAVADIEDKLEVVDWSLEN
ncbi:Solute carrier 26 [Blyttiomyces sp. JEL0837]|nr:Solute carrier 26 [Blyttiomyces sp. JEL0837]